MNTNLTVTEPAVSENEINMNPSIMQNDSILKNGKRRKNSEAFGSLDAQFLTEDDKTCPSKRLRKTKAEIEKEKHEEYLRKQKEQYLKFKEMKNRPPSSIGREHPRLKIVNLEFFEISRVGFALSKNETTFKCVSTCCNFRCQGIERFIKHLVEYHENENNNKDTTICKTCNCEIKAENITEELEHMLCFHLKIEDKTLYNRFHQKFHCQASEKSEKNLQGQFSSSAVFNTPPYEGNDETKASCDPVDIRLQLLFGEPQLNANEKDSVDCPAESPSNKQVGKEDLAKQDQFTTRELLEILQEKSKTNENGNLSKKTETETPVSNNTQNEILLDETEKDVNLLSNKSLTSREVEDIPSSMAPNEEDENIPKCDKSKTAILEPTPTKYKPSFQQPDRISQIETCQKSSAGTDFVEELIRKEKPGEDAKIQVSQAYEIAQSSEKQYVDNVQATTSTASKVIKLKTKTTSEAKMISSAQLMNWISENLVRKNRKTENCYKKMLQKESLAALYKCMDGNCSFATNKGEFFFNHLLRHEYKKSSETLFLFCSYCTYVAKFPKDLAHHVTDAHSPDIFQCSHCFFRSRDQESCLQHILKAHERMAINIFECRYELPKEKKEIRQREAIKRLNSKRDKNVKPIKCDSEFQKN